MIHIKDIRVQTKTCLKNGKTQHDLGKVLQLYVVTTRKCNASCEFCEFKGEVEKVNLVKFKETFEKLSKYFYISAVHFTGGEPSLEIDTIRDICDYIKEKDVFIFTSANTNGIKLNELKEIKNLDNVALSRHGLSQKENENIFKTSSIANEDDIKNFPKNKLHLSCNMIKGYVDSEEKIYDYLDKYSDLGVYDVGFVNLMKINEYCKEKFAEFPKELSKCTQTKRFQNIQDDIETCQCRNWLYSNKNCNFVSIYNRHVVGKSDLVGALIYENNKLYAGWGGEEIQI